MTIREYILSGAIKSSEDRLEKLIEMGAPSVMTEALKKSISDMKEGKINIGGDVELLDTEIVSKEKKTGNMGKTYIQINGNINFFPNAKYGLYIKRA